MDFSCRSEPSCMKKYCGYCCPFRRELLKNCNFEKNIKITPRIIICKTMKRCETYCESVKIENLGTVSRRMKFYVDPESDVSFKVQGNTELFPGRSVTIELYVEPNKKKDINRDRYFYALTEHPDIVFEVPIIVSKTPPEIYIPSCFCLHKVPPNTATHYQFVIYNPFECEFPFTTCSTYENITFSPPESVMPAKNFCTLLLTAKIPNQASTIGLVITVKGKYYRILVHMEPSDRIIHLSTPAVVFDDMYMGLKQQKTFYICNKSLDDVNFLWTTSTNVKDNEMASMSEELRLNDVFTIKSRRGCISSLNSALSIVTFSPSYSNFSKEEEPPFNVNLTVYLCSPLKNSQFYQLQIAGTVLGPEIEIAPCDIDFGDIYLGQLQCLNLDVENKGPISGEVFLRECTDEGDIYCTTTPNSVSLKPGKSSVFALRFYRKIVGKFLTRLTFKITGGKTISILLRGNTMPTQVKIWPKFFDLSEIPLCIPQKRFALVANPLPVSIVVEPSVVDEGTDNPLILCVDYSKLPLHTTPELEDIGVERTFKQIKEDEIKPSYSDFELHEKPDTIETQKSDLSWLFEDKVLEKIPTMADELLKNIRQLTPQFQAEPGMKIIDAALDCILNQSEYFDEMKKKQGFLNMCWERLPENPKEIAIEKERFYLKPNESKSFPVILIPNSIGPNTRKVQFRACPLGVDQTDMKTAINSKDMLHFLKLEYKTVVPDLDYKTEMKFSEPVYLDQHNGFHILVKNKQNVSGFVYFKSLIVADTGTIRVAESHRKFFIPNGQKVKVPAWATFRKIGKVTIPGEFQMVGRTTACPFTVTADVLPPKIRITPEKLTQKQPVLKCTRTRLFIENIGPTIAKFHVTLKNEKNQHLEPLGGQLAPGQKIQISMFSRFLDPGVYKNALIVHMSYTDISVPVLFTVDAMPLLYEPNIKNGFDCGALFRSEKVREYSLNIQNAGQKSYRVLFKKQVPKGNIISPRVFDIQPPGIWINPKESVTIKINVDMSREVCAEELYSVDGLGEDNARYKAFAFACKCEVIQSRIEWSKPDVQLECDHGIECLDKMSDAVNIINSTPLSVNVNLTVFGWFSVFDETSTEASKSLNFTLEGNAAKKLLVKLKTDEVETYDMCQCFEGTVKCRANGKVQKSLGLHARIVNPAIKICNPDITFFTQNMQGYAHITLQNDGSLPAKFHWNRVSSEVRENAVDTSYESVCAKTISDTILAFPDEFVPVIPSYVNTTPEIFFPDTEYSDEGDEEGCEEEDECSSVHEDPPVLKQESLTGLKKSLSPAGPTSAKNKADSKNTPKQDSDGTTLPRSVKKEADTKKGSNIPKQDSDLPTESKSVKKEADSKKGPNTSKQASEPVKKEADSKKGPNTSKQASEPVKKEVDLKKSSSKLDSAAEPIIEVPKPQFICKKPLYPPRVAPFVSENIDIEQILDFLKLPRPKHKKAVVDFQVTPRTTVYQFNEYDYPDKDKLTVQFQDSLGVLQPKTIYRAYVFLPRLPRGWLLEEKYQLLVEGGKTETLDIKESNVKGLVQISETNIDLAGQLWYKTLIYKIELKNPCPFAVKINIVEDMDRSDLFKPLINGNVKVTPPTNFIMLPAEVTLVNCHVIMGLCYNYVEDIAVEVNNCATGVPVRFHGSGLLPMVFPRTPKNLTRKSVDTVASYLTMRSVYDGVKSRNKSKQDANKSISLTPSEGEELNSQDFRDHFVALNDSEENVPRALEIERLIETGKFIAELKENEVLKLCFHKYYCKCMYSDVTDMDPVVNLKLTICRPVPWEIAAYVLDMGNIVVNETKCFQVELTFLGPGRVFLSARTRVVIPGLTAWFNETYDTNYPNSFVFYVNTPDESKQKLYRNMSERDAEDCTSQSDPKLEHAHSFDVDSTGVHKRTKRSSEAGKIKDHYNKISFPQKAVKNPLVLAEMCQIGDTDWHNRSFQLVILFTALGGCFEITQTIDDYLLIDVHLGPTLPIQLQGCVTNLRSSETSNEINNF